MKKRLKWRHSPKHYLKRVEFYRVRFAGHKHARAAYAQARRAARWKAYKERLLAIFQSPATDALVRSIGKMNVTRPLFGGGVPGEVLKVAVKGTLR